MIHGKISIILGLSALLSCGFSHEAVAFGYAVRHVMYENGEEQLLSVKEEQGLDMSKKIHNEMVKQVGLTQQLRSSLGDTRIMYEKDRLIGTLEDYDTIMRSLLFFQTRDSDVIGSKKNKNFAIYNDMMGTGNAKAKMEGGELVNVGEVIGAAFKGLPSAILRNPDKEDGLLPLDKIALAGDIVGGKFFIHAYTKSEQNAVPATVHKLIKAYRSSFANDVSARNYVLGMYARAYLAERAMGNGIGRHLYGKDEIIDTENNPWRESLNIIGGLKRLENSAFVGALKTEAQTIANAIAGDNTVVGACKAAKNTNEVKTCIWQIFSGTGAVGKEAAKTGVLDRPFSYTKAEKDVNRISITGIRQQISLNTIMWIRASLEVSTLMLLTSAQLELEAAMALSTLDDGNYWINPADGLIWGETICPLPEGEDAADDDGTRWAQNCLSEQERGWLTPSFDWDKGQYKYQSYVISGKYKKDN